MSALSGYYLPREVPDLPKEKEAKAVRAPLECGCDHPRRDSCFAGANCFGNGYWVLDCPCPCHEAVR